jgi:hypothetical protein
VSKVCPPLLATAETTSVNRPTGNPPPNASSTAATPVGTQPAGLRFFSGKRAASRDRRAESVEAEPDTGVHLVD